MKKKTGIGIGIAIVVFVTVFGIAALPDEVLLDPPYVDTSEGQIGEEKKSKYLLNQFLPQNNLQA